MNSVYAQKSFTIQNDAASTAASVLDSSSQGEALQRKADLANNAAQCASLPPRPNNTGMPDNLKAGIESLSGFSMDDVRVHYNSSKPATLQALAYTQGTDIHVAPGQEKCLPHEAWHVAQQKAGRVSPTTNINGMPVNDNAALEHEADVMGEKAVQCKKTNDDFAVNRQMQRSAIQRKASYDEASPSETMQTEDDEDLVKLFGRGGGKGTVRPDNVARYVDQFKREMLTYIASCIADKREKDFYGPHISVVITRGIWFIAINSDCSSKDKKIKLSEDAGAVKNEIIEKWNALEDFASKKEGYFQDEEGENLVLSGMSKDINDDIAKKQALYITYRWAGKDHGIIVEQNKEGDDGEGAFHGEMLSLDSINRKSVMFKQAACLFTKAEKAATSEDKEKAAVAKAAAEIVALAVNPNAEAEKIMKRKVFLKQLKRVMKKLNRLPKMQKKLLRMREMLMLAEKNTRKKRMIL